MARLGGTVTWGQDPNDTNENNIYSSEVPGTNDEKHGRRLDGADSFVIP